MNYTHLFSRLPGCFSSVSSSHSVRDPSLCSLQPAGLAVLFVLRSSSLK